MSRTPVRAIGRMQGAAVVMAAASGREPGLRCGCPADARVARPLAARCSTFGGGRSELGDLVWSPAQPDSPPTVLSGHHGTVHVASFSADGQRVVTAGDDRTARVFRIFGANIGPEQVHEGSLYFAAFSPGRPVAILAGYGKIVRSAEFSHDGQRVVTGSDDGTAKIWRSDGNGDVVTLYGHEAAVLHASFSPDDRQVVTASSDRSVRVWAADFDNPDLLRTKIKEVTTVCLIPAQRTALLGETPADAETRHRDCETQFKR